MERKSLRDLKKMARNIGIDTTGMSRATLEYEIAKLDNTKRGGTCRQYPTRAYQ